MDEKIGGLCYRELFTHKPGEQFLYEGRIFTRLVFPHSLLLCYDKDSRMGHKPDVLEAMRTSNKMYGDYFLAADQSGVVSIFSRNELVITVDAYTPPVNELVNL